MTFKATLKDGQGRTKETIERKRHRGENARMENSRKRFNPATGKPVKENDNARK